MGDLNVCDDIVHDAVVRIISKVDVLREMDIKKRRYYAMITAENMAKNYIRDTAAENRYLYDGTVEEKVILSLPDYSSSLDEEIERWEEGSFLLRFLDEIPETGRRLLVLRYELLLSDRDIAELLDMPYSHVRVYANRLLRRLKRKFESTE